MQLLQQTAAASSGNLNTLSSLHPMGGEFFSTRRQIQCQTKENKGRESSQKAVGILISFEISSPEFTDSFEMTGILCCECGCSFLILVNYYLQGKWWYLPNLWHLKLSSLMDSKKNALWICFHPNRCIHDKLCFEIGTNAHVFSFTRFLVFPFSMYLRTKHGSWKYTVVRNVS